MGDYKSKKRITAKNKVNPKQITSKEDLAYYSKYPSWVFHDLDSLKWTYTQDEFWNEIYPKLKMYETQTWHEIFIDAKKQNHKIDNLTSFNKVALNRLNELQIENGSILSLRLSGTHRLYGFMTDSAFHILWYDKEHGDNDYCVCRSRMSHT